MVHSYLGANCFPPTAALISQLFFFKSTKSINIPKGSFSSCWCDYKAQCALIGFINWVIVGIECQYFTHKFCSIKLLFNARDLSFVFLTAKAHKALLQSVNPVLQAVPGELKFGSGSVLPLCVCVCVWLWWGRLGVRRLEYIPSLGYALVSG